MSIERAFGAILSPVDVRDYYATCTAAAGIFPEEFELAMPAVKNQGRVGSCVAHAIATTIEYFNKRQNNDDGEMSVGYIYGNRESSSHRGYGMIVRDAIKDACMCGSVPLEKFPYNEEVPGIIEKLQEQFLALFPYGYPNRFTTYYRLNSINDIKASLMENGAVIFAMRWYDDIRVVDGVIQTAQESYDSSHCMVIYGWNQDGWKIQNSWGEDWGNGGRAILPYNINIRECWGIIDTYSEVQKEELVQELTRANNKMRAENECLRAEISKLLEEIGTLMQNQADNQQKIDELTQLYNDKLKELAAKEVELQDKQKNIQALQDKLVQIQKPYNSVIGKIIAKVINVIINLIKKNN